MRCNEKRSWSVYVSLCLWLSRCSVLTSLYSLSLSLSNRPGARGGLRRGWGGSEPGPGQACLCEWNREQGQARVQVLVLIQPLPQRSIHSQQDTQALHLQTAMTPPQQPTWWEGYVILDVVGVIFFALSQKAFTPEWWRELWMRHLCWWGWNFFFWREDRRKDGGREMKTDGGSYRRRVENRSSDSEGREERNGWDSAVFCMSHLHHTTAP